MRLYVSVDLEGVAGVVAPAHLLSGDAYRQACEWMTEETVAVIEGARLGGATEIIINDAHEQMINLRLDRLPDGVEVITGRPKAYGMMAGIDHGFDVAFFLGYHGRQGSPSVLCHSYSSSTIARLQLNGQEIGEFTLNALLADHFGVPVGLVSGDQWLAEEIRTGWSGLELVMVKQAMGRQAAKTLLPCDARKRLRQAAQRVTEAWCAGKRWEKPKNWTAPWQLQVDFFSPAMAQVVAWMPLVRQHGENSVQLVMDDLATLFRAWQAILTLAGALKN
ncbi:M55 family metallopeptidase [Heliophilum fasciatum]|uniref:D-amino peptidase n=1 Tax=Heliophilum fasciatum TaxID=35700 RepID=A0A4R2RDG1_9FIRM|nr:M55 family metallopeptidase [Heliophilum fasciatum]MCW2279085.1 D-amino peptidase [Heliophilum fasciatum]TCP61482.1 D-amino peptidase [Heliophilum fasciatum]